MSASTPPAVLEVQETVINRGGLPCINDKIDIQSINECVVYDELGNQTRFGDLHKDQKTIIIFIRHYLCFFAFDYVKDLARIKRETLEAAGVKLVIIGCSPYKFTREFRRDTACPHPIYADVDKNIYSKLGCKETGIAGPKTSKHVSGSYLMGVLKSTMRAVRHREYQGEVKIQGASLILGPGDKVDFIHLDNFSSDHMPINDLLRKAGIQPVNYEKDPRVLEV